MNYSYTIFILLLPLVSFIVTGLGSRYFKGKIAGLTGTTAILIITLLSYYTFYLYFITSEANSYIGVEVFNVLWLSFTDSLQIHLGILIDPLSVLMFVVITTVSLMVHIYSLGYMKGDPGFERYFAFLSLFTFSMLGLVVATNLFQMYIFWELVGVSSYLLIGFYYEKPSAVAAAKKAFIVTRFADLGFLIGILMLSYQTSTFSFTTLTSLIHSPILTTSGAIFMGMSVTTWAMLLLFMGGAGKSAMFPLHIWLPDAMEGPTPVSALIHAATMVVAGVYLVARLFPVYYFAAPDALEIIMYVGSFTSLFAAVIACTQLDIKRVLAFSTISQLGYMMVALGVSGYGSEGLGYMASMFHLFTHAFFKALLFLGAGSVIHAIHSNLMTHMGGLRRHLPITHFTFLMACLAIAGIPPFSGFFSKDEILVAAYEHSKLIFAVQYAVAGITAFYMFRLYFKIFWNGNREYTSKPHESPVTMTGPLIFLAMAAIFSGLVPFHDWVTTDGKPLHTEFHWTIALLSVLIAVFGIMLAAYLYLRRDLKATTAPSEMRPVYKWVFNKFYIDELYLFITRNIIYKFISRPIAWFDRQIIDGAMNSLGTGTIAVSVAIRKMQSGHMQVYIWFFASGVLILTLLMWYLN